MDAGAPKLAKVAPGYPSRLAKRVARLAFPYGSGRVIVGA